MLGRRRGPILASIFVLMAMAGPSHADFLDGKQMRFDYLFPDEGSTLLGFDVVVGPGVEVDIPGDPDPNVLRFVVDLDDNTITHTIPGSYGSFTYQPATFNGFQFSDSTGEIIDFASLTIDPSTSVDGFDLTRVDLSADRILVNLQGLTFTASSILKLRITPVPEPSVLALIGGGLIGLLGFRPRRPNSGGAI